MHLYGHQPCLFAATACSLDPEALGYFIFMSLHLTSMSKDIFSILYSITSIQDLYMYAGTRDSVQECLSNLIAFLLGLGGMSRTQYIKKEMESVFGVHFH